MRHAKAYADEMFESEEALERATGHKQGIRSRMHVLDASLFTGHGYEFTRTVGDEKFTARKLKRGSKPADTVDATPDFETDGDGKPIDALNEDIDGESLADA